MKDKKLIILYVLMLVVGLALLFTKSSPPPVVENPVEQQVVVEEPKVEPPKTEIISVAFAKHTINKKTILTKDDYYFKSIEVDKDSSDKSKYITDSAEIDAYVAKNNIAKDSFIEHSFIASPNSPDYLLLALKEGNYMFPFKLEKMDSYLTKNLKSGDLVDFYLFYSDETVRTRNKNNDEEGKLISPSNDFAKNRIKPIIVGKKIIYIDLGNELDPNFQKNDTGQIQLELSNQEIKLLRTLMTNSKIMIYPSIYKENVEDGLRSLSDKEKKWPLSDKDIFLEKQKRINLLKGN
jgi:pilus assembly protein CpaB